LARKEETTMAIRWWQWRNIQERLRLFGRAVQGPEPYRIAFADDPGLTGLTDFDARLIRVNPEIVPGLRPRRGYEITKAVLCHEAGHRRFTTPARLPAVVHMVSNILEDQRIESLMMEEFAGTRPLIRGLTEALYDRSPELEPTDDAGQVWRPPCSTAGPAGWGRRLRASCRPSTAPDGRTSGRWSRRRGWRRRAPRSTASPAGS
jgi:hypothetical protein